MHIIIAISHIPYPEKKYIWQTKINNLLTLKTPRKALLCLLLFLSTTAMAQNDLWHRLSKDYQGSSLSNMMQEIEEQTNIRFYYKDAWINSIGVQMPTEGRTVKWVIDRALIGYGLNYIIFQGSNMIFVPEGFTVEHDKLEEGMVGYVKVIGNVLEKGKYKKNKVEGIITDSKTGDPVIGAVVNDKKHRIATTSDINGHYEIMLPLGQTELEFSFIGLETTTIKIDVLSPGTLDMELLENSIDIETITIMGEGGRSRINRTQMGLESMDMRSIGKLPVLMGEADIIKTMTLMPGVQSTGEMASGFSVRGGNVDQNLVLLNDVPLYSTSHLFGLFSTFIPNAVSGIDLHKGTQGAQYGSRISSVMDISLKKADTTKFKGNAGIGILNSHLFIESPISKHVSFMLGGRTTYSNWILAKLHDANIRNSQANFYDMIGKVDIKINRSNNIEVYGYQSYDRFDYARLNEFEYSSTLAGATYRSRINTLSQLKVSAAYSGYKSAYISKRDAQLANEVETGISHIRGKAEYSTTAGMHNIILGAEGNFVNITPGEQSPYGKYSNALSINIDHENGLELAGFASDNITLTNQLNATLGLRYSWFTKLGGKNRVYQKGKPINAETLIADSPDKDKNVSYGGIEPRLGLRLKLGNNSAAKLGYSFTRQYQQLMSANTTPAPFDYWKLADRNIEPLKCQQVSLGLNTTFLSEMYDFSAEFYYKTTQNQTDYKNGAILLMNNAPEQSLVNGEARAYGVELMLKKNFGSLTGWLSYTLSKAEMRTTSKFAEETINNGDWYRTTSHHLHDLSLTTNWQATRRWNVATNFVLTSGRPCTMPEQYFQINNMDVALYSARNKYDLPTYHRLDLSVTYDAYLNKKHRVHPSLTFAIYNLYGHHNVYSAYYKKTEPSSMNGYHTFGFYKLSIIGSPIPSVTLNLTF